jgi:hypothetical protein
MAIWKLETRYKKNIQETEYFNKDGQVIEYETWWRWGYAKFDVPDDVDFKDYLKDVEDIDLDDDNGIDIYSLDYDLMDHSFDDGVACSWTFPDDMDEEEQERIQELFDEEWHEGMENDGWEATDREVVFHGPFDLTKEEEDGATHG